MFISPKLVGHKNGVTECFFGLIGTLSRSRFGFCNSETSKADFFVFVVEQKSPAKSCNAGTKKLAARRLLDATLLDRFKVQLYCLYNSIDELRELGLKAALAAYQVVTPPYPTSHQTASLLN